MSFTLDESGKPDIERMHPKTKERLITLLRDPEVARSLGLGAESSSGPTISVELPREYVLYFVGALSQFQTWALSRATKAPDHIIDAIAPWSPAEQDQIADPLGKVLEKYAGDTLTKYGPEIGLGTALLFITMKKLELIEKAIAASRGPQAHPRQAGEVRSWPAPSADVIDWTAVRTVPVPEPAPDVEAVTEAAAK